MKANGKKGKWMVMVNFKKQINKSIKEILNRIKDMDMVSIYLIAYKKVNLNGKIRKFIKAILKMERCMEKELLLILMVLRKNVSGIIIPWLNLDRFYNLYLKNI